MRTPCERSNVVVRARCIPGGTVEQGPYGASPAACYLLGRDRDGFFGGSASCRARLRCHICPSAPGSPSRQLIPPSMAALRSLLLLLPTALIGVAAAWSWVRTGHGEAPVVRQERRRRATRPTAGAPGAARARSSAGRERFRGAGPAGTMARAARRRPATEA